MTKAMRERIYGILYEQLDLSSEVIIELAECGNLGDVTDAILAAQSAAPVGEPKCCGFCGGPLPCLTHSQAAPPPSPPEVSGWQCLAISKAACAWPDCGCDPEATKVIAALVDQGWTPANPGNTEP